MVINNPTLNKIENITFNGDVVEFVDYGALLFVDIPTETDGVISINNGYIEINIDVLNTDNVVGFLDTDFKIKFK